MLPMNLNIDGGVPFSQSYQIVDCIDIHIQNIYTYIHTFMAPGLFPAFSKPMVFEGAYPENEPVTTYIYIYAYIDTYHKIIPLKSSYYILLLSLPHLFPW